MHFLFWTPPKIKLIIDKYESHCVKLYHKHDVFPHYEPRGHSENGVKLFGLKCLRGGVVDTRSKSIAQIEFLITCVIGTTGQNFFFLQILILDSKSQS